MRVDQQDHPRLKELAAILVVIGGIGGQCDPEPARPDLAFSMYPQWNAQTRHVFAEVTNAGVSMDATFTVRAELVTRAGFDQPLSLATRSRSVDGLATGAYELLDFDFSDVPPTMMTAGRCIKTHINPDRSVNESSYDDNDASVEVRSLFGSSYGTWVIDPCLVELSDSDLMVYTVNAHGGDGMTTISSALMLSWWFRPGIYALQESGGDDNVAFFAEQECVAFQRAADVFRSPAPVQCVAPTHAAYRDLGIVVLDPNWEIVSNAHWRLGTDDRGCVEIPLLHDCGRYLLEAVLQSRTDARFRFRLYVTHLSHGDDQEPQREEEIARLKEIVRSRVEDYEGAPIIAGDFNLHPRQAMDGPGLEKMGEMFLRVNTLGAEDSGLFSIDQIYVGYTRYFPIATTWQTIRVDEIDLMGASDHTAFAANFHIRGTAAPGPVP